MDNAQHDRSAELVRYLDKEMSNAEQSAFEAELAASGQLRAELENLQAARQSVILYGIKEQLSKIHREERGITAKETPVFKLPAYRKFIRYSIAAAACLILIFFAVDRYNYSRLSADRLFAEQYTRFEPSNSRGDSVEITAIEKAYLDKDYKEVIGLYKPAVSAGPRQMIMAGVAYLETGQVPDAIAVFQLLLSKNKIANTTSFNDEASYYLALSYLKNKDYSPAIELMEKIHADKENVYSEKFPMSYIERVKKLSSK